MEKVFFRYLKNGRSCLLHWWASEIPTYACVVLFCLPSQCKQKHQPRFMSELHMLNVKHIPAQNWVITVTSKLKIKKCCFNTFFFFTIFGPGKTCKEKWFQISEPFRWWSDDIFDDIYLLWYLSIVINFSIYLLWYWKDTGTEHLKSELVQ